MPDGGPPPRSDRPGPGQAGQGRSEAAESEGTTLAIEDHTLSILDTPERIAELIEVVGSGTLRFNMDPVNFVGSVPQALSTTELIDYLFDVLGRYTICGHAKDLFLQDRLI